MLPGDSVLIEHLKIKQRVRVETVQRLRGLKYMGMTIDLLKLYNIVNLMHLRN